MNLNLFIPSIICVVCLLLSSCSSSDNVKSGWVDLSNMHIERMDLSEAISLGIVKNNTPSHNETFLKEGLYKIDSHDNIIPVKVYFVEERQNGSKVTQPMFVKPSDMYDLSQNYFIIEDCQYYDENNQMGSGSFTYCNLLVRKSDGKIWCVDNVDYPWYFSENKTYIPFKENNIGELFCYDIDTNSIYKFNLDKSEPSLEKKNVENLDSHFRTFHVTDNELIWYENTSQESTFLFSNGTIQKIARNTDLGVYDDYDKFYIIENKYNNWGSYLGFSHSKDMINNFIIDVNHSPYLISLNYDFYGGNIDELFERFEQKGKTIDIPTIIDAARIYKLDISNQTLSPDLTVNPIMGVYEDIFPGSTYGLNNISQSRGLTVCSNDRHIIMIFCDAYKTYISLVDYKEGTWHHIGTVDYLFRFDKVSTSMQKGIKKFALPEINGNNIKLHWIDFDSLTLNETELTMEIPSENRQSFIQDGYAEYISINSHTGKTETIRIDLSTGEVYKGTDQIFDNIILLN